MQFKNKIILVTGAGSGIGRQITCELLHKGATVIVVGRDEKKLKFSKDEIGSDGSILSFSADISSSTAVEEIFASIDKKRLTINGLVNSAAINPSRNNIINTSIEDFESTINTNLKGAFLCTKEAVKRMINTGGGSIVNIASIAGLTALPERAAYMTSKWGLVGLTKSVALDFASNNIRVNCVCPGYTMTPLVENYLMGLPEGDYKKLISAHPMKKLGTTKQIAQAVLFFLSEQSTWITGTTLPVDGGYCTGKEY